MNFHCLIDEYNKVTHLSLKTRRNYCKALHHFCSFLADQLKCKPEGVEIDKIYTILNQNNKFMTNKPIDSKVLDFFLLQKVESSYSKLSTYFFSLRSFFRFVEKNYNFKNIVMKMQFVLSDFKPVKKPRRILSRHEVLKFLHSLVSQSENVERDTLLFTLLLSTGCRISEVLNIKVSDIDLNEELIFLKKTKTKVPRVAALRDGYGNVIKAFCKEQNLLPDSHLFNNGNVPLTYNNVKDLMQFHLKNEGLPPVGIHSLRHSFATFMYEAGSEITTIQQLLGHESILSTLIYVHPYYTRNLNIKIIENDQVYQKIRQILKKYI